MKEIDYSVRTVTDADIGLYTGKNPLTADFGFVVTVIAFMITPSVMTIIHLLLTEAEGTNSKI